MNNKFKQNQLYFKDTSFAELMTKRIFNVLLIANPYDAFMLEDDGRIEEKIFNEYAALSLSNSPRFMQVSSEEEAWKELQNRQYQLVIFMPGSDKSNFFAIGRAIKNKYPHIPIVVLTPFSYGVTQKLQHEDLSSFEYVFCWLGNTDLIVSIIKLIEDKMNLKHDIKEVGVQLILLVDDSIRFYSSMLPHLYKFVLQQSKNFATEALNAHQKTLRMRGRPKIALARDYEEAIYLYNKYADNVLGVITDIRYPHNGKIDPLAGVSLCKEIREIDPFVPLIMQSREKENRAYAIEFQAAFIDKTSKTMDLDLQKAVKEHFGFGDFIFLNPYTGKKIATVHNLKELQNIIFAIPNESMTYHVSHNHVSRWLYSRAMFPMAKYLRGITWDKETNVEVHRKLIYESIIKYRKMKNQGIVAEFQRDRFDNFSNFARIGDGSLGGKGRGLAFVDHMIKCHPAFEDFENTKIVIPKTVVLCTDFFNDFMEMNNLYSMALSDAPDDVILKHFLKAQLPDALIPDFFSFFDVVKSPIAIRSSSLLEDSHYQPFAGVYNTYMIPCLDDKYERLRMLSSAIKAVYASVYFKDSKAYMKATSNVIDQEKMAVILQEVVGNQWGDRFYPSISGVARSLNFYPIGDEKPEEGTVNLALGLGKYIVDGGKTLRFSPYHPHNILQTSEVELALKETQTEFFALDLTNNGKDFSIDDGFNILKLPVKEAENDGSLQYIASTYNAYDQVIQDGIYPGGRKLITFANILQHDVIPLAEILRMVMKYAEEDMQRSVEIEFAVNLNKEHQRTGTFYLLQIRPIVDDKEVIDKDLTKIPKEHCLLASSNALGHGINKDMCDVVYVKTESYSAANNRKIGEEIEKMNQKFMNAGKNYLLIGPGRWGSNDEWLGIPVKWSHISAARLIVEASLTNYRVDPSQGTHFFQNLTSLGVGYFTINPFIEHGGFYDQEFLNKQPASFENEYIRHVHFDTPFTVMIDGKKSTGVVLKPDFEE